MQCERNETILAMTWTAVTEAVTQVKYALMKTRDESCRLMRQRREPDIFVSLSKPLIVMPGVVVIALRFIF